jgi:hypothetical protein
MQARAALRFIVVVSCVLTLLGHVCLPLGSGQHAVALADASVTVAPADDAHHASCETLAGSSVISLAPLAADTRTVANEGLAEEGRELRHAPAPIPRPPRFLLFASLLN